MINQSSDESIASVAAAERSCVRPKSRHGTSGRLATFIRRRESPREINSRQESKKEDAQDAARAQTEHRFKATSTSGRVSFGFFRNIKKYLQIKNLCRSKQKSKEVEALGSSHGTNQNAIISIVGPVVEPHISYQEQELLDGQQEASNRLSFCRSSSGDVPENSCHSTEENVDNITTQCKSVTGTNLNIVPTGRQDESMRNIATVNNAIIIQPSCSDAILEVPNTVTEAPCSTNETLSNENKAKASLAEELLNLSKYGWYWGPISVDQADAKLISEPDGAFLVRDSSDDRYVLTLSFKSAGKMLHARMEHSGGLFSLCNQRENEGFTSVAALINHSMNFSQSAVFCYSRPRYPGYPSFPVRLTKPVSRFTQVKSLQYLCRFVIRQNTSLDNIRKLPLPETIKLYILEAHY